MCVESLFLCFIIVFYLIGCCPVMRHVICLYVECLFLCFIIVFYLIGCSPVMRHVINVRNRAKISNQYNQAPHLTQDTNGKVRTSQLDITNESR